MLRSAVVLLSGFLTLSLISVAPALAQTAAPAGPASNPIMQLVPFIAIFAIMYFMMIRPQAKRQKTHQEFLQKLQRGEEVLTSGGLLGRVEGLTDIYVTLEIATNVRIKILRTQIASYVPTVASTAEVKA
jgi:preprotein translocase subunit YajC